MEAEEYQALDAIDNLFYKDATFDYCKDINFETGSLGKLIYLVSRLSSQPVLPGDFTLKYYLLCETVVTITDDLNDKIHISADLLLNNYDFGYLLIVLNQLKKLNINLPTIITLIENLTKSIESTIENWLKCKKNTLTNRDRDVVINMFFCYYVFLKDQSECSNHEKADSLIKGEIFNSLFNKLLPGEQCYRYIIWYLLAGVISSGDSLKVIFLKKIKKEFCNKHLLNLEFEDVEYIIKTAVVLHTIAL